MRVDKAFSKSHGRKAGEELVNGLNGDFEIVFVFPTTLDFNSSSVRSVVSYLRSEMDVEVVGVSIGGFATEETDGLVTRGFLALGFDAVFEIDFVEDIWNMSHDRVEDYVYSNGFNISLQTGSRAESGGRAWAMVKRFTKRFIRNNILGSRRKIAERIDRKLKDNRIGYHSVYNFEPAYKDNSFVNIDSGDMGDFLNGYEFFNEKILDSKAGISVRFNENIVEGVSRSATQTRRTGNVLRTFDDLDAAGKVIYGFEGKSLSEIFRDMPVNVKVSRGNFTYYFVLEKKNASYTVPVTADLNVIISPLDAEEFSRGHLVRAPDYSEFSDSLENILDTTGGLRHFSFNPAITNQLQGKLNGLINKIDNEMDEYILTFTNLNNMHENSDYNFPNFIEY